MKILHCVATLNLEDGGPTRSVTGLCNAQTLINHNVVLICLRTNLQVENFPFKIIELKNFTNNDISSLVSTFEIIHIHGIWPKLNHQIAKIAQVRNIPYFISPRGMLQHWAMEHKWLKKKIAWFLYQKKDLVLANKIIVTAESERKEASYYLPHSRMEVLPNGIENLGAPKSQQKNTAKFKALFLSRIHSKKGINDLIPAWCKLAPENWALIIAGPDEEKSWKSLETKHDTNIHNIQYVGQIDGVEKANLYKSADVFILPTYSENFGLVVAEALSLGVPVVTTSGTPWSKLPELNCGWYIKPGQEALEFFLPELFSKSKVELFEMGQNGVDFIKYNFDWKSIANKSIDIYRAPLIIV